MRKSQTTISLPVDLLDALDEYCARAAVAKTRVIEVALREFLASVGEAGEPSLPPESTAAIPELTTQPTEN